MPSNNAKRKKHHDKDKYYHLAKEQGLRSRAAFKLSQINRKYHLLEDSKVVLDLCAAPGGWSQIAAKSMKSGGIVIAVDILPIRPIRDVITIIGDVTTEECRVNIRKEMQNHKCDLVLSDGAPNVGFDYMRDAYEQNEIALMSLRCATEHLKAKGSFVCKVYRSTDYTAFLWVVKQLFREVDAVKPSSSRSQSSEIFLVCRGYLAPTGIDPRMLDPKTVFEHTEAGTDIALQKSVNIFHKKYNEQKRFRQGYDFSVLDSTLRNIRTVAEFIDCSDPIKMLTDCTAFSFVDDDNHLAATSDAPIQGTCKMYLEHPKTTSEIKACCADLKVLGKTDFKGLLTWRLHMAEFKKNMLANVGESAKDGDQEEVLSSDDEISDENRNSSDEEDDILSEIEELRKAKLRKKKRIKKKEREAMAKLRRRKALGMDHVAIDLPDNDKIFSLATISNEKELEKVRSANLSKVDDEIFEDSDDEAEDGGGNDAKEISGYDSTGDVDEENGYSYRLDKELDEAYESYLKLTKNKAAKAGTKMAKRSKKLLKMKAAQEASEDAEMMMSSDTKTYASILNKKNHANEDYSDDSDQRESDIDSDDDDDGFHADPITPEEHAARMNKVKQAAVQNNKSSNPLIHEVTEKDSVVAARWFSNPLFDTIGNAAQSASLNSFKRAVADAAEDYSSGDEDHIGSDGDDESVQEQNTAKGQRNGIDADEVLAEMPKTDKQIRHERRMKARDREARRQAKKARMSGLEEEEMDGGFEVVNSNNDGEEKFEGMDEKEKKKLMKKLDLIKAGMGKVENDTVDTGFEVVAADALPRLDDRKYDSENEDYDSDDQARTLALGTMMLRRSKAKELVDASYNRFAWNDPPDLPDFFVDDEAKNYRPQLPIPPELLAKMKERFASLAAKPIAKVAEARARKNKRAAAKLAAAKKKAATVANSSEMSEAMKLKAISKAMRGHNSVGPRKRTVVAKKGGISKGGKGIKLVDKRMKNDTRSMKRAEKKKGKRKRK